MRQVKRRLGVCREIFQRGEEIIPEVNYNTQHFN